MISGKTPKFLLCYLEKIPIGDKNTTGAVVSQSILFTTRSVCITGSSLSTLWSSRRVICLCLCLLLWQIALWTLPPLKKVVPLSFPLILTISSSSTLPRLVVVFHSSLSSFFNSFMSVQPRTLPIL